MVFPEAVSRRTERKVTRNSFLRALKGSFGVLNGSLVIRMTNDERFSPKEQEKMSEEKARLLLVGRKEEFPQGAFGGFFKEEFISTGAEALSRVKDAKADVVVATSALPDISGPDFTRLFKSSEATSFIPLILIVEPGAGKAKIEALELGADDCIERPIHPQELLARIKALLRIKNLQDQLQESNREVSAINRRLADTYARLDRELALARRLQGSLLPKEFPQLPGVVFAAKFVSSGRVTGDFYDIFRLDEEHVGFYVADVMGHGVPAALLTIFIKKGVVAKEISGKSYRILPPEEVLYNLNRDIMAETLSESLFVTMCYGLLNFRSKRFSYARAGHPYPLLVHAQGKWELLQEGEGGLLGIMENDYFSAELTLAKGDKLILYTDGVDNAQFAEGIKGTDAFRHAVLSVYELGIKDILEKAPARAQLKGEGEIEDDVTFVGVEVTE